MVANIDTGVRLRPPGPGRPVPRQPRRRRLRQQLQLVRRLRRVGVPARRRHHGTHTMGTIVGDDGGANQIGVAPGAKWIASNAIASATSTCSSTRWSGCSSRSTSTARTRTRRSARTSSATRGASPACPTDPFGDDIQQAWIDSGIFGTWSNRNLGPGCDSPVAWRPRAQLLQRRVRHQPRDRRLLVARSRPGRDDQAEHLRPGRGRPLVDPRRRLRPSSRARRCPRRTSPARSRCCGRRRRR